MRILQTASSGSARDINRRIVLNLIRTRQPISRADLARLSGLQRSTVSLITEELIAAHWVEEGPTGRLPRGRRPTYLRLNERRAIIGVDIRPVNTTVALSDVNARFSAMEVFPTPKDPCAGLREIAGRVRRVMESNPGSVYEGIGISLPGRVDLETQRLVFAPNLNWRDVDLKTPLAEATGLDVELENAANACALAEVWFGGDHSVRDLVVITVSEGIGTGVFLNGQLVRGPNGMAGEFGHTVLDPQGPPCHCGNRGCWEVFGSNSAAIRYYLEGAPQAGAPTFQDLLSLADQGDVLANRALDQMARWLGRGAATLAVGLAPASLMFVGELTKAWRRFGPSIEKEIAALRTTPSVTRVVAAEDGGRARLRGTVALVLQKHFGIPSFG